MGENVVEHLGYVVLGGEQLAAWAACPERPSGTARPNPGNTQTGPGRYCLDRWWWAPSDGRSEVFCV